MRESENMREVAALQPDYFGLIFYPKSPRSVTIEIAKTLPKFENIKRIGVFVNESVENILTIADQTDLAFVQLHGAESPEFCREIKRANPNLKIIKAFAIDENFAGDVLQPYETAADFFLFDTKTNAHGGSGKSFDWQMLQNLKVRKPFFLGGGINAENAVKAIAACQNLPLHALDVNSRAELAPGVKSPEIIREITKVL